MKATTPQLPGSSLLSRLLFTLALIWGLHLSHPAWAGTYRLSPTEIVPGVYALIGDTGGRTFENHGLNNNMGFIVTDSGVILIDPGATPAGAAIIEKAIGEITDEPVRWVINTGSQDHRWLGNSYFTDKGAEIIALRRTIDTQRRFAKSHIANLKRLLRERADGLRPVYAEASPDRERMELKRGGKTLELIWLGDAHFPGDAVVWLPEERVVFTGDLVYMDRMLGLLPDSPVVDWQKAFSAMVALEPLHIVPGHGDAAGLAKAKRDTGDYLDWLIREVGVRIEEWKELDETVDELGDAPQFKHLRHYESWHKTNVNRTFLQLEAAR